MIKRDDVVIDGLPYHELQYVADINIERTKAKAFTDDPVLFTLLLIEGHFARHALFQHVDAVLLVWMFYTDSWEFFDRWFKYHIRDGALKRIPMNDKRSQVVVWRNRIMIEL